MRMSKKMRERAFILPVTVVLSFLVIALFIHITSMYIIEKKAMKEIEGFYNLEQFVYAGFIDISNELIEKQKIESPYANSIIYPNAIIEYNVVPNGYLLTINMKCKMNDGRLKEVYYSIDTKAKAILYWSEV